MDFTCFYFLDCTLLGTIERKKQELEESIEWKESPIKSNEKVSVSLAPLICSGASE
jgi:hypothetical protein